MTVWVDGWQFECCGEPFRVGSRVEWSLHRRTDVGWLAVVLGPEMASSIDLFEDHHTGTLPESERTTGTVAGIAQVHCRFDPAPVPGSGLVAEVHAVERWVEECGDRRFSGFLVQLDPEGDA